ncbi:hypothetical protein ACLPJF_18625 [Pseudomonas vlassakiae]
MEDIVEQIAELGPSARCWCNSIHRMSQETVMAK